MSKPIRDRRSLAEIGVFYDENIITSNASLPSQVEILRESMLDFSYPYRRYDRDDVTSSVSTLEKEEIQLAVRKRKVDPTLIAAQKTLELFRSDFLRGREEKVYQELFTEQFFDPLFKSYIYRHSPMVMKSRRSSRSRYYYDAIESSSDKLWTVFSSGLDNNGDSVDELGSITSPKPDHAFYFPIHAEQDPQHAKQYSTPIRAGTSTPCWHEEWKSSLAEPFSWSLLQRLSEYGLEPSPFGIRSRMPDPNKLSCYPWLVIEYKREDSKLTEAVCCQAANALACAVKLNRNAARYATPYGDEEQVPPVPAITTIGPKVKVWIMCFSKELKVPTYYKDMVKDGAMANEGFIMRAIWEGDMTQITDVVKFRLILENTHTWATRVYKPLLSSYINQWKIAHCHCGPNSADAVLSRQQEAMDISMIQRLLKQHPSIEMDGSQFSNVTPLLMGLLVKKIYAKEQENLVTLMDRMLAERLEGLKLPSRGSVLGRQEAAHSDFSRIVPSIEHDNLDMPQNLMSGLKDDYFEDEGWDDSAEDTDSEIAFSPLDDASPPAFEKRRLRDRQSLPPLREEEFMSPDETPANTQKRATKRPGYLRTVTRTQSSPGPQVEVPATPSPNGRRVMPDLLSESSQADAPRAPRFNLRARVRKAG